MHGRLRRHLRHVREKTPAERTRKPLWSLRRFLQRLLETLQTRLPRFCRQRKLLERSASMDERKSYVERQRERDVSFMEGLRRERECEETLAG